jgi:hypothetical protein
MMVDLRRFWTRFGVTDRSLARGVVAFWGVGGCGGVGCVGWGAGGVETGQSIQMIKNI